MASVSEQEAASWRDNQGQQAMYGELRVGFFENFKGHDSLLFCGDATALERLTQVFQSLASGASEQVLVHDLPFVRVYRLVSLIAERSRKSSGLRFAPNREGFIWRLSAEDWEDVALRIVPLGGGHQYFDYLGVQDDVQIIVSAGEYDEPLPAHKERPPSYLPSFSIRTTSARG
jgi:hypothetical protein